MAHTTVCMYVTGNGDGNHDSGGPISEILPSPVATHVTPVHLYSFLIPNSEFIIHNS